MVSQSDLLPMIIATSGLEDLDSGMAAVHQFPITGRLVKGFFCQTACAPKALVHHQPRASMCLAKSSTSNRRERIAYRELVLERLRLVRKGHWTLGRRGGDFVVGTARCAVRVPVFAR